MLSRLIIFATAALCAVHLHVGATTIQPVDDGLRPVYERIAAIEAEVKTLEKTRDGLEPQTEERSLVDEKIKKLQSERGRLEGEVMWVWKHSGSLLVTYMVPATE